MDADKLAAANKKADKVVIQKMNHIFKEATLDRQSNFQTYNQPELPIKPELVKVIGEFALIKKSPNKKINKDKKQLAFAPSSLILANYFLPVIRALGKWSITI